MSNRGGKMSPELLPLFLVQQYVGTRTSDSSLCGSLDSWAEAYVQSLLVAALLSGTVECFSACGAEKKQVGTLIRAALFV